VRRRLDEAGASVDNLRSQLRCMRRIARTQQILINDDIIEDGIGIIATGVGNGVASRQDFQLFAVLGLANPNPNQS
jgi:hypothetical protein